MNDYELPPGTVFLGHAIGHAAAMYHDPVDDYDAILRAALRGRHRAPATTRILLSDYAAARARQLIAEADGLHYDPVEMAGWIGAATEIMKELTRNA